MALSEADVSRIAQAVAAAMGHTCHFPEAQRQRLHQAAEKLSEADLITMAWLCAQIRRIADAAGRCVAKLVFVALLGGLAVAAMVVLLVVLLRSRGHV